MLVNTTYLSRRKHLNAPIVRLDRSDVDDLKICRMEIQENGLKTLRKLPVLNVFQLKYHGAPLDFISL